MVEGEIEMSKQNAVEKFNSLSEDLKLYHRAIMSLQRSIHMVQSLPTEIRESLREYKQVLIAEIEYIRSKTREDPRYYVVKEDILNEE